MKLNEFVGIDDCEDKKLTVGVDRVREMLERKDEVDTSAFLYVYRTLTKHNMPPIAAERALTRDWENHPMFGIGSPDCKDKWATAFQEQSALSDEVFDVLQERAVSG